MEVVVSDVFSRSHKLSVSPNASVLDLINLFSRRQGIPSTEFYVKNNGRLCGNGDKLRMGVLYRLEPRLCGGKGGFGSMLRALGAQIEKTTNREACRDLSGRRLRDVNHEKEMAEWLKSQADREAEKEQRRMERLQRKLAEPKHYFTDPNYAQQCHELAERLEDSVLKGMQASSSGLVKPQDGTSRKRPIKSKGQTSGKKKCFWTGAGGLEDMVSSEDDSDAGEGSSSPSPSSSVRSAEAGDANDGAVSHSAAVAQGEEQAKEPSHVSDSMQCSDAIQGVSGAVAYAETAPSDVKAPSSSDCVRKPEEIPPVERPDTACSSHSQSTATQPDSDGELDLLAFGSAAELETVGPERLKVSLMGLGMKCGGTLQERAARLFSVRGLPKEKIDAVLLAKPIKGKKK